MCLTARCTVRLVVFYSGVLLATSAAITAQNRHIVVTVSAPEPRLFEVSLDEVVVETPHAEFPLSSERVPSGVTPGRRQGRFVSATVAGAASIEDVVLAGRRIQSAFPDVDFALVLYEVGIPRVPAARALLTREIGLLLDATHTPETLVPPSAEIRAVRGVPGAFVARAADPLAALHLAELLRGKRGVRSVYPLLKRQEFPR